MQVGGRNKHILTLDIYSYDISICYKWKSHGAHRSNFGNRNASPDLEQVHHLIWNKWNRNSNTKSSSFLVRYCDSTTQPCFGQVSAHTLLQSPCWALTAGISPAVMAVQGDCHWKFPSVTRAYNTRQITQNSVELMSFPIHVSQSQGRQHHLRSCLIPHWRFHSHQAHWGEPHDGCSNYRQHGRGRRWAPFNTSVGVP